MISDYSSLVLADARNWMCAHDKVIVMIELIYWRCFFRVPSLILVFVNH